MKNYEIYSIKLCPKCMFPLSKFNRCDNDNCRNTFVNNPFIQLGQELLPLCLEKEAKK